MLGALKRETSKSSRNAKDEIRVGVTRIFVDLEWNIVTKVCSQFLNPLLAQKERKKMTKERKKSAWHHEVNGI